MTDVLSRLSAALADRYRLEHELGQGGMATVYLAEDLRHDRKVAVKVLKPELSAILGGERFLAEIKTTANLQHPHILSLFDSGEADGLVYYVMPYVDGESLRDRLTREKQLPVDEAVGIAREVADALHYAHGLGIVHRDIKPENVLLHGGHALVADFGIALAASRSDGGTRMTETGMSLGTPHYMAPEQAMGEREITPKADIYALGCVLYEMLTAEPPFVGATAQAIIARVMTEEPRSLTLQRRSIPVHVEAAVRKALEKLPADRFATAAEFAAALVTPGMVDLPGAGTGAAGQARRARRLPLAAAAAGALVLGAVGLLIGRLTAPTPAPRLTEFDVTAPESVTTIDRCCSTGLALSPDGSRLVFIGVTPRGPQLFSRLAGRVEAEPIRGTEDAVGPFFSPDGRWLGFQVGTRLRKIALTGGSPITIADIQGFVRNASWGDHDDIVFSVGNRTYRLYRVPAAGGTPQPISAESSDVSYRHPTVLPGSRRVLLVLHPRGSSPDADRIGVMDLTSGSVDTLTTGTRALYASGHLLFATADGTVLAQPFDPGRGRLSGQAVSLLDAVVHHPDGNAEFAVSASGAMAYMPSSGGASAETLMLVHGRAETPLTMPRPVNFEDPAVSPDGRRIAMRLVDDAGKNDLWIFDRNLGTLTRLTVDGGSFMPVWSPDGRQLAFASNRQDSSDAIFVQPADGSGPARLAVRSSHQLFPVAWLHDGRFVFVSPGNAGTFQDIGIAAPGDTAIRWIAASEFQEHQPSVSPDERWIAYASNRSGGYEVYVQALSGVGAVHQVSVGGGDSPRWSRDGRTLYYATDNGLVAARVTMAPQFNVSSRAPVLQGQIDLNSINTNYDVVPRTGELLVIIQGATGGIGQRIVWIQHWPEILREMAQQR